MVRVEMVKEGNIYKRHYENDEVQIIAKQNDKYVIASLDYDSGTTLTPEQVDRKVRSGGWELVEEIDNR